MKKFFRHLIAAILCRCPKCWKPLACQRHWVNGIEGYWDIYACPPRGADSCYVPAWSLHRLIEICSESYDTFNINVHKTDLYDFIISTFEHLRKQGKINKEYLKQ